MMSYLKFIKIEHFSFDIIICLLIWGDAKI